MVISRLRGRISIDREVAVKTHPITGPGPILSCGRKRVKKEKVEEEKKITDTHTRALSVGVYRVGNRRVPSGAVGDCRRRRRGPTRWGRLTEPAAAAEHEPAIIAAAAAAADATHRPVRAAVSLSRLSRTCALFVCRSRADLAQTF